MERTCRSIMIRVSSVWSGSVGGHWPCRTNQLETFCQRRAAGAVIWVTCVWMVKDGAVRGFSGSTPLRSTPRIVRSGEA
jgi:hypothetical protein